MKIKWNCELTRKERINRYIENYLFNNEILCDNKISDLEIIYEINKIKNKYYENNTIYKNNYIINSEHIDKLQRLELIKLDEIKIEYMEKIIQSISHIKC